LGCDFNRSERGVRAVAQRREVVGQAADDRHGLLARLDGFAERVHRERHVTELGQHAGALLRMARHPAAFVRDEHAGGLLAVRAVGQVTDEFPAVDLILDVLRLHGIPAVSPVS
jgi:hypothetical protein